MTSPPLWQDQLRLPPGVIGRSPALLKVFDLAATVSPLQRPVLIRGPSGSGKTALALFIAAQAKAPHVVESCADISDELLSSKLFGHVRGSFTGATSERKGLLRAADGGTLILDEIGKTSLALQRRLLTLIDRGTLTPLGSDRPIRVRVRLVAITCDDLEGMVREGRFLPDLLHRLSPLTLFMPGLEQRGRDVLDIAEHLLQSDPDLVALGSPTLSAQARERLLGLPLPGQVRGLARLLLEAVLSAPRQAEISAETLSSAWETSMRPVAGASSVQATKEAVLRHLQAEGPCTAAALRQATGVPRATLSRWLREWQPSVVATTSERPPRYALVGHGAAMTADVPVPQDPVQAIALSIAAQRGRVAPRHLAARFEFSAETARRRLKELQAAGLLDAVGRGRARAYTLTELGRQRADDRLGYAD